MARDEADGEPDRNISGGESGGGVVASFDPSDAETVAESVVDRLGELYWTKTYGGREAFECLVRTILSQNTSDAASQPAHDELMDRYNHADLAESLRGTDPADVADAIESAGLYNQKAQRIVAAAQWVCDEFGSTTAFDNWVREADPATVRETLLSLDGVGPKTADCVLLFAGGAPGVFPVDTHVHRVARRLGVAPPAGDHEAVRKALESSVPDAKCGFGHTAMIQFGREYCTARRPACLDGPEACPLSENCEQVGIDVDTDSVVDPASVSPE